MMCLYLKNTLFIYGDNLNWTWIEKYMACLAKA